MTNLNIESLTILSTLFVNKYENVEGTQLINVSSVGGYGILATAVTYCATKFYVSAFTEGIAGELKLKGAKMQAKVLAPAATETEFAINARENTPEFDYNNLPKFHTSKEVSEFLIKLYQGNKVVGLVNPDTYEFNLMDPIYRFVK
jgi:short-subunit dehydrogenase